MTRTNMASATALLACTLLLAACCGPARAGEPAPSAEDKARALADEVLRRTGDNGNAVLGKWTRSVVERALQRAGEAATRTADAPAAGEGRDGSPAPLPAERQAAAMAEGIAGRRASSEVLVFLSLSVPEAAWRQWAREAARAGTPLVLRGIGDGGLRAFAGHIWDRTGDEAVGIAVDPRLFRLFGVDRVPAVVAVPGGVPPCTSRGCAGDAPPSFDVISGNIGLAVALEAIATEGKAGRDAAERMLERLREER